MSSRLEGDQPAVNRLDAGRIRGGSFLVLFFKKEQKEALLFEKRSKNFYPLASEGGPALA
jgi:hypothetical protein